MSALSRMITRRLAASRFPGGLLALTSAPQLLHRPRKTIPTCAIVHVPLAAMLHSSARMWKDKSDVNVKTKKTAVAKEVKRKERTSDDKDKLKDARAERAKKKQDNRKQQLDRSRVLKVDKDKKAKQKQQKLKEAQAAKLVDSTPDRVDPKEYEEVPSDLEEEDVPKKEAKGSPEA